MIMNPYLEQTNGKLNLPAILEAGNITLDNLPRLSKFYNATTGKSGICWSHVLGPCHFPDRYFARKGGHPTREDYTDQFADNVVAIVGPAVAARMQNMAHNVGAATKKLKAEQGTGA